MLHAPAQAAARKLSLTGEPMPTPETRKTETRRGSTTAQTNRDVVIIHGDEIDLSSNEGRDFVADCVRAAESLIEDKDIRDRYEISPQEWGNIKENKALIRAIKTERTRRVRSGQATREMAQKHLIKAPGVLDSIMSDTSANPRHRIESAKELRATATSGDDADAAGAGATFSITINLPLDDGTNEVHRIEKPIKLVEPVSPINAPIREIE